MNLENKQKLKEVGVIAFTSMCLAILISLWVGTGYFIQSSGIPCWLSSYCVHSFYAIGLIPWAIWCKFRKIDFRSYNWNRSLWCSLGLSVVYMICGGTWYMSVQSTSLSANTAIYNSVCVFVFLLSLIILKEKFRILPFLAVVTAITGVVVITVFRRKDEGHVHETIGGYMYVIASTFAYALYEIIYEKWGDMSPSVFFFNSDEENVNRHVNTEGLKDDKNLESEPLLNDDKLYLKNQVVDIGIEVKDQLNDSTTDCSDSLTSPTITQYSYSRDSRVSTSFSSKSQTDAPNPFDHISKLEKDFFNACFCLGLIGVCTFFTFWIALVVFHYSGYQTMIFPSSIQWVQITLLSLSTVVYDVLLLICIDLTSAQYVSVATMLTIPCSIFIDVFVNDYKLTVFPYCGIGLIVIGFVGLNVDNYLVSKKKKQKQYSFLEEEEE